MLSSRAAATRRTRYEARMTFFSRRVFLAVSLAALAAPALADDDAQNTLILTTKNGKIVIRLWPKVAPKTVAQIKTLVKRKFYDGQVFHRVIPGFMAQTGDPTGTGTGKSDLPNIPGEFSKEKFLRGTVGMARGQDNDSANCQFFICFAPARYLEEQYTVWGEVISGMEFIDKVHRGEPPKDPDKIIKLRLAGDES